jgi:hypothetical protein
MLDPRPTDLKPWLLFKNPVFDPGVNVTVRLGTKWFNRIGPEQIVEVRRYNSDGIADYLFDGFIVDVIKSKICDIDEDILAQEHDPGCRTIRGLVEELKRVYPKEQINGRTTVTIIFFEECEPDPGEHDAEIEPPRIN